MHEPDCIPVGTIVVEVVNVRKVHGRSQEITYVGRPSIYGNPFPMRRESERESVCLQYEQYFNELIEDSEEVKVAMENLVAKAMEDGYIRLGCFCAPRRCHADTQARWITNRLIELGCETTCLYAANFV
jgi:hypothetical protein